MAQDSSVAPKERVNIVYKSETGNAQAEKELPLKMMLVGDYTQRPDDRPVEERQTININKDNFNEVLRNHNLELNFSVPDKLSNNEAGELPVKLKINNIKDFGPESVAQQVPELRKLLELRAALSTVKGPLGNVPAFRKKLQEILNDEESRKSILGELGLLDE